MNMKEDPKKISKSHLEGQKYQTPGLGMGIGGRFLVEPSLPSDHSSHQTSPNQSNRRLKIRIWTIQNVCRLSVNGKRSGSNYIQFRSMRDILMISITLWSSWVVELIKVQSQKLGLRRCET